MGDWACVCFLLLSHHMPPAPHPQTKKKKKIQHTRHTPFNHRSLLCKYWLCWQLQRPTQCIGAGAEREQGAGSEGFDQLASAIQPTPFNPPPPITHLTPGRPLAAGPRAWHGLLPLSLLSAGGRHAQPAGASSGSAGSIKFKLGINDLQIMYRRESREKRSEHSHRGKPI